MSEKIWQGEERVRKWAIGMVAVVLIVMLGSIDLILIVKMTAIKPFIVEIGELTINDSASNMSIHLCGAKIIYDLKGKTTKWEKGQPCPDPIQWRIK